MNAHLPATTLVLGASGTIGFAIAKRLLQKGHRLGLHAFQHPERCASSELPATPSGPVLIADFRDPAQVEQLAKDFLSRFGRIDALVWAAGIAKDAPALTQKAADVREVLAVNLTAPLLLLKACSRQFLKQRAGAVVVVSSHAALSGRAGGAAYAMAQAGLLALVKSMAREWGPSGIRVNAVVPPFVRDSAMGRAATPEFVAAVQKKNVLKIPPPPAGEGQGEGEMAPVAVAAFVADLLENPTASGQVFVLDSRIA